MQIGDVKHLFNLKGKTALITGGGRGLGGAIAEGFAQFGADVAVVDINTAESVADEIRSLG
jgi:NAD(P)-dependent dehydrogenase (short-subunit alcohol dehydrogenase family)